MSLNFLTEIISFCSWIICCKFIPIHSKMLRCIHRSETFNSQRVLTLSRPHHFVNSYPYFHTFWPLQGHMITITWFVIKFICEHVTYVTIIVSSKCYKCYKSNTFDVISKYIIYIICKCVITYEIGNQKITYFM